MFSNPLQDELDEFGNIDYVCAQGKGTDWPFLSNMRMLMPLSSMWQSSLWRSALHRMGNCAPPIVPASLLFGRGIISRKTLEVTFYLLILIRGPGRFILRFRYDNVMIINVL